MDLSSTLGLGTAGQPVNATLRRRLVNLQLLASGLPAGEADGEFAGLSRGLVETFHERARLLAEHRCPADQRIEAFLREHLAPLKLDWTPSLPDVSLVLDQHGIARELSLPAGRDEFTNDMLSSYRLRNGVLHNPKNDRRTTAGTFHVTEGGLPIPGDKKAVPQRVFAELLRHAVKQVPPELTLLPYSSESAEPAHTFVSLLLRPIVCPEVPGVTPRKTMEVRFFAPGSLVSNLDFVESIFSNAGDPFLAKNDAALDVEHWTGHTGCVILAPHLSTLTKKQLGLPNISDATDRQKRDRMCWKDEAEKYNDGVAFKLTCRTAAGVIVTLIADNYYGYCKKEVKTQISYAANLFGNVEEEHAGGAIAFQSYSFGEEYQTDSRRVNGRTFEDVKRDYASHMHVQAEGYGIDKVFPDLLYIPHDARGSIARQQMWWTTDGKEQSIPLLPGKVYMTPSGFKVRIEKHPGAPSWRIVGSMGEGTFCHKPCTVSGGGKSEISKSLIDYMIYGPIFVVEIERDLDIVGQIFEKDYSGRWRREIPESEKRPSRPILSQARTLGSVIKLLTPSTEYNDAYNAWLASIPSYIYPIVFIIKRFYRPDWGTEWRQRFNVDIVNGLPGYELKYGDRKLVGTYLRVGLGAHAAWRTYKVRQDFAAASKIQTEDDISASVVVPAGQLSHLKAGLNAGSYKFALNCEYRLFQRPDDAIYPGFDKQTELDMSRADNFISNFEPLTSEAAAGMVEKVTEFDRFTPPMRELLRASAKGKPGGETIGVAGTVSSSNGNGDGAHYASGDAPSYVVCSAKPRIVDGKPTKNPRYLQIRPDLVEPTHRYVAEMGVRLYRAVPPGEAVLMPVEAVLVGRRNNPAEPAAKIRGLAAYNPIHYQELPELFMEFVCSLTGKSPSTTGAGSEGALTKAPFNAVRPTVDLNNAIVSYILTGLGGFSSAAGYVGPKVRVDHDISLLVPEIWCRLTPAERDPSSLIKEGYLEKLEDFQHQGKPVLASRLGYRITGGFVRTFFGRIFDNPSKVFDDQLLKPESQDFEQYVDSINNIVEAQKKSALGYFEDGSIADACPPLVAILHIMAHGQFEGKDARHPDIRKLFTRDYLLASDWYAQRLKAKQKQDVALWTRHVNYLEAFMNKSGQRDVGEKLGLDERRKLAAMELERVSGAAYVKELVGTLGVDPSCGR